MSRTGRISRPIRDVGTARALPTARHDEAGRIPDVRLRERASRMTRATKFGLDQGQRTIDQSAASRGILFSGKTLRT